MPIVEIKMWFGRTKEMKQNLVKKVTKAVSSALDLPQDHVTILIHEIPKENWAQGGKTFN